MWPSTGLPIPISFHGVEFQFPDYLFGEAILFSPDSHFVALEQLVETTPFRTKLVTIALPRGTVHVVRIQQRGSVIVFQMPFVEHV